MREDIKSMTLEELRGAMAALGQPAFRAGQIYTWLHRGSGLLSGDDQPVQGPAAAAGGPL